MKSFIICSATLHALKYTMKLGSNRESWEVVGHGDMLWVCSNVRWNHLQSRILFATNDCIEMERIRS